MNKFMLSLASFAVIMTPVAADAAQCRNAKGQFAKCGAPGSLTDAQYKALKGKSVPAPTPSASASAKPSLLSKLKPSPKPTPSATPSAKPSAKPSLLSKLKPKPKATPSAKPTNKPA